MISPGPIRSETGVPLVVRSAKVACKIVFMTLGHQVMNDSIDRIICLLGKPPEQKQVMNFELVFFPYVMEINIAIAS